jgi:hypothetical protein
MEDSTHGGIGGTETMPEAELRQTVREYLQRRGYTRAEATLLEEERQTLASSSSSASATSSSSPSSGSDVRSLAELSTSVLSPGHASAGQVVSHYSKEETLR